MKTQKGLNTTKFSAKQSWKNVKVDKKLQNRINLCLSEETGYSKEDSDFAF